MVRLCLRGCQPVIRPAGWRVRIRSGGRGSGRLRRGRLARRGRRLVARRGRRLVGSAWASASSVGVGVGSSVGVGVGSSVGLAVAVGSGVAVGVGVDPPEPPDPEPPDAPPPELPEPPPAVPGAWPVWPGRSSGAVGATVRAGAVASGGKEALASVPLGPSTAGASVATGCRAATVPPLKVTARAPTTATRAITATSDSRAAFPNPRRAILPPGATMTAAASVAAIARGLRRRQAVRGDGGVAAAAAASRSRPGRLLDRPARADQLERTAGQAAAGDLVPAVGAARAGALGADPELTGAGRSQPVAVEPAALAERARLVHRIRPSPSSTGHSPSRDPTIEAPAAGQYTSTRTVPGSRTSRSVTDGTAVGRLTLRSRRAYGGPARPDPPRGTVWRSTWTPTGPPSARAPA